MNTKISCLSKFDLHLHTTYSDGRYSPAEIVQHAAEIGLTTIAITDHDNAHGARAARLPAQQAGIHLIPGIEFTCRWDACQTPPGKGDIDVLGYWIDLDDPAFCTFEQQALDDIHERVSACCARLTKAGYPISMADVRRENPHYAGILQLLQALTHKGYIDNWGREGLALLDDHWPFIRPCRFPIDLVIDQIHRAGGVAILAHPSVIQCANQPLGLEQVTELAAMGLDGLEIYHHRLDQDERRHFLSLAEQLNLLISGGSDLHGWFTAWEGMGNYPVTQEMVQALYTRHMEWKDAS